MAVTLKPARTAHRGASSFLERLAIVALVVLGSLFASRSALAYPWMIRHDYVGCTMCHADPSGAGIVTPYGRAQSEVLLRTRYGQVSEDEDPTRLGGFGFGLVPLPEWLDLQADARSLLLRVAPSAPAPSVTRTVLMQADGAAALRVGALRASGALGYVHEGALNASVTRGTSDRLVSRQHWIGAAFGSDDSFLVRVGRMNLPYGLRILEHTSFVRASTLTDINAAQQHGAAIAYNRDSWRGEAMMIAGNYQLRPDALRERGVAAYLERTLMPTLAVGATTLVTHADVELTSRTSAFRQAHGVFGRWVPTKMLVVMAEADVLVRSPKRQPIQVGTTGLLQLDLEPIQGVHVAATGEFLTPSLGEERASFGGWLSAFWFFLPHLDVRGDVIRRSLAAGNDNEGVTMFLAQLHGWL